MASFATAPEGSPSQFSSVVMPVEGAPEATSEELELLVVRLGACRFAVPVISLREVRPPGGVVRVPAGELQVGVLIGCGAAVAVVCLASVLRVGARAPLERQWVVVLDGAGRPLGLAVDEAEGIVIVAGADFGEPAAVGTGMVVATALDDTAVLNVEAVLRDPRLAGAAAAPAGLRP